MALYLNTLESHVFWVYTSLAAVLVGDVVKGIRPYCRVKIDQGSLLAVTDMFCNLMTKL
jgi:hypothetical protein